MIIKKNKKNVKNHKKINKQKRLFKIKIWAVKWTLGKRTQIMRWSGLQHKFLCNSIQSTPECATEFKRVLISLNKHISVLDEHTELGYRCNGHCPLYMEGHLKLRLQSL